MFGTSKALLAVAGLLAGTLVSPAPAAAQEPTTITGCLSKGAAGGSFSIKGDDGKTYALTSTSVKLDGHVGHKVTVTGNPAGLETGMAKDTGMARDTTVAGDTGMKHDDMKHDAAMATDTGMKKEAAAPGGGAFEVTNVAHVSAECK